MRVLISGFEPFGGRDLNPTALLVEALKNKEIPHPAAMTVDHVLLPVTFEESFKVLNDKITDFNPDVIMCFGQAAGRSSIELEEFAFNKIDADIQDNNGDQPKDQFISHDGAPSYLTTLPIQGMENALKHAGIPVKVSRSAGSYVCNFLFYRLMQTNQETLRLCGFIHVPLLPEQAKNGEPSLPMSDLKNAVTVMLEYIDY